MHEFQTHPRRGLRSQISCGVGAPISSDGAGGAHSEAVEGDFSRDGRVVWVCDRYPRSLGRSCAYLPVGPPRYSPAQVAQRLKSISARLVFQEFPEVKRRLWGGELWNDGYFVRSVGDKVTAEVIRRYIKHQHDPQQLDLDF